MDLYPEHDKNAGPFPSRSVEAGRFDELLELVPRELYDESGEVFYSGRTAFESRSRIYLLGLNPGGDPVDLPDYTVRSELEAARTPARQHWSSYSDDGEVWDAFGTGARCFRRSVLHLLDRCELDPRDVPSSNAVFVRSAREATLGSARMKELLRECWPVHEKVVTELGVRVVVCFGETTASWVRAHLGAHAEVDRFVESNNRGWTSTTHQDLEGIQVVKLSHPSTTYWENPAADPSELVIRALVRAKP